MCNSMQSLRFLILFCRYLWIRLALSEKRLAKIIEYLVENAHNYYEPEALMADPDYGGLLSSLLMGPCALEYTKAKTTDQLWPDPPADELVGIYKCGISKYFASLNINCVLVSLAGTTSPYWLWKSFATRLPETFN